MCVYLTNCLNIMESHNLHPPSPNIGHKVDVPENHKLRCSPYIQTVKWDRKMKINIPW